MWLISSRVASCSARGPSATVSESQGLPATVHSSAVGRLLLLLSSVRLLRRSVRRLWCRREEMLGQREALRRTICLGLRRGVRLGLWRCVSLGLRCCIRLGLWCSVRLSLRRRVRLRLGSGVLPLSFRVQHLLHGRQGRVLVGVEYPTERLSCTAVPSTAK